ncbi:MAG: hypothetical protein DWI57_18210 [Chloroflexi bacterium]|nr:MAG: hypothetical protein DWI57_18210 [Chloroflexota bacterium]
MGAVDADDNRCDPATYPSFENHCFVVHLIDPADDGLESRDQLLLRDQATYCLGQSHRLCPRFRLRQSQPGALTVEDAPNEAATSMPALGLPVGSGLGLGDDLGFDGPERGPSRLGVWAGVATLLLVFMLCGGSLAAYAGWRLVGQGIASISQRAASQPAASEPGTVLVLVTATSQSEAQSPAAPQLATPQPGPLVVVTELPTPTATFAFPAAVTPTPASSQPVGPVVITTPTPADQIVDPLAPALATAVAGALVITQPGNLPPTPTRRSTPEFVVPTSTPGAPLVAGVSATATPNGVLPTVSFRAANQSVLPGACTILSWDVENARAVFLDNVGVPGRGERQVCLRTASQTHTLDVLRLDGSKETHTVFVEVVPNTVVPTVTPTNTPVLTPTPTWTPEGTPSATPIPPSFGVQITVDGGNQRQCTPGQRCDVNLLIQNTGSLADEMFVDIGKSGPWSAAICRDDGSCADTSISVGVAAGGQRTLLLAVNVPGDAAGQSYTFQAVAASGNSGRTVSSGQVSVTLRAQ